jgi:hypothetical protein
MIYKCPSLVLIRQHYDPQQTPGKLLFYPGGVGAVYSWHSLEAGWKNNAGGCIPEGIYVAVREKSPKFGMFLWEIYNVEGRNECKIHKGNYYRNFDGCVGIGQTLADLDKDGKVDITNTNDSITELMKVTEPYRYLPLTVTGPEHQWIHPNSVPMFATAFT